MDNQEMLAQVLAAMNDQTEMLVKMIDERVVSTVDSAETRINLKLENDICKRIDTLFDGYKLTHEKQFELEREVERLKLQVDEIRNHLNIAV